MQSIEIPFMQSIEIPFAIESVSAAQSRTVSPTPQFCYPSFSDP
jgi:hypothetical protein